MNFLTIGERLVGGKQDPARAHVHGLAASGYTHGGIANHGIAERQTNSVSRGGTSLGRLRLPGQSFFGVKEWCIFSVEHGDGSRSENYWSQFYTMP